MLFKADAYVGKNKCMCRLSKCIWSELKSKYMYNRKRLRVRSLSKVNT